LAQSTVYWPFQDLVAPICALSISAMSVGRAINEVPVRTKISRHHDETRGRPTGVDSGASAVEVELVVAKGNLLEFNFPVSPASNGDVVDLASIRAFVDAAKDGLAAVVLG